MNVFKLSQAVSAHAWSPDGSSIAVCENSPDVVIYTNSPSAKNGSPWVKTHILKMHTMVVSGIDWSAATNKIVTCSPDVNAFVWTFDQNTKTWTPKVSILKIVNAAIRVKWSPDGQKFAVASGSKVASICYFMPSQDWWVSQLTARGQHKSTVLDVAWHPSSQLFATVSCDFKCRIFSGYIPYVEKEPKETPFGTMEKTEFGQLITHFQGTGAWIEAVAWSPSGNALAFVSHDATISFADLSSGTPVCTTLKTGFLPFTRLIWLTDNCVVASGYDFAPVSFKGEGSAWEIGGFVDGGVAEKAKKTEGKFKASMNLFKAKVTTGTTGQQKGSGLLTSHTNLITDLNVCKKGFSSCGNDGNLVIWKADGLI